MDWKDIAGTVGKAAPLLGTLVGGPAGAAVGGLIASALGAAATPDDVSQALSTDPEAAVKLRQIEADRTVKLQELVEQHAQAELQAHTNALQAEAADRADARGKNSGRDAVWWIATAVLTTFAVIMATVLYGCWQLLGGGVTIKDVSVVAAISGLVGSVVGYVAANAQTVVNFIFGGSLGSERKTDALAAGVQQAIQGLGNPGQR